MKIEVSLSDKLNIEEGAAIAHAAWSHWMEYLFSKSQFNNDGSVTIPKELVERWTRQSKTPYALLPEKERQSDRTEAKKYIDWLRAMVEECEQ